MKRRREERERERERKRRERTPCSWNSVKPYGVQWTLYILQFTFLLFSLQNTFLGISFSCFSSFRLIWVLGKLSSSGSSAMKTPIFFFWTHERVWIPKLCFFWNTQDSPFLNPFHATCWNLVSKHNPLWTQCTWLLRTPLKGKCNASTLDVGTRLYSWPAQTPYTPGQTER
jgi:hypothetical protein